MRCIVVLVLLLLISCDNGHQVERLKKAKEETNEACGVASSYAYAIIDYCDSIDECPASDSIRMWAEKIAVTADECGAESIIEDVIYGLN